MAKNAKKSISKSPISLTIDQNIETFGSLGKRIELGSKTKVSVNKAGFKMELFSESVMAHFGIGKDHVGYLVMPKKAWEALRSGEEITTTTLNEFKKNFL